jgi:murein L,D-transpeptidase YafK
MKRVFRTFLLLLLSGGLVYYFFPEKSLPANTTIDQLEVHKSERKMFAYSHGSLVRTYVISLGKNPTGNKQAEGDGKTPEGNYTIDSKNAHSDFYRNLGISFPNRSDLLRAKNTGLLPGGDIKIHGLRNGLGFIGKFQRWYNWTSGCIAVTDAEMDELFDHVPVGTPIVIKP